MKLFNTSLAGAVALAAFTGAAFAGEADRTLPVPNLGCSEPCIVNFIDKGNGIYQPVQAVSKATGEVLRVFDEADTIYPNSGRNYHRLAWDDGRRI